MGTHKMLIKLTLAFIASIQFGNCKSLNSSALIINATLYTDSYDTLNTTFDGMADQPVIEYTLEIGSGDIDAKHFRNGTLSKKLTIEQLKYPFLLTVQISGAAGVALVMYTFYKAIQDSVKPDRHTRLVWAQHPRIRTITESTDSWSDSSRDRTISESTES